MAEKKTNSKKAGVKEVRVKPKVIRRRSAPKVEEVPDAPEVVEASVEAKVEADVATPPVSEAQAPEKTTAKKKVKKSVEVEAVEALNLTAPEEVAEPTPAVVAEKKADKGSKDKKEVTVFEAKDFKKPTPPPSPGRPVFRKGKKFRGQKQPFRRHNRPQISREVLKTEITTPKASKMVVKIVDAISVGELSQKMGVKSSDIIRKLMAMDIMATVNQLIEVDAVTLIAEEFGYEVENVALQEDSFIDIEGHEGEDIEKLPRPPVVTVMGHVDHGKTSLLDAIRSKNVVSGEAGGITQHIGAYHVELEKGNITFLDTPGHEAFTAMRSRGASATDIVILVVAADDGVMPQTVEAIDHAKAAEVPIIVAVNKCDLPGANPDKVKQALSEYELVPEDWGGTTIFVDVSAKDGTNLDKLLDMVLLQSEMLELAAPVDVQAKGIVIEAHLDKGRGAVSTVLVQSGVLNVGDAVIAGLCSGRVRAMFSDTGKRVKSAGPSMPVEIIGISDVPLAGDPFVALKNEASARQLATLRQEKAQAMEASKQSRVTLEDLYEHISLGEMKELNIIIKGDVQGSVEAVRDSLLKITSDEIRLKVLHIGVGGINEGDIMLASASNAIVVGFNVRPEQKASALAEKENVDVRLYTIIYDLVEEIRQAFEGMLKPIITEEIMGRVEIREVFKVSRLGNIAGCHVTDGVIKRDAKIRLIRDNVVIYEGELASLKRFKDDAKEVKGGFECGLSIQGYNDIKVGDIVEPYEFKEEAAKL